MSKHILRKTSGHFAKYSLLINAKGLREYALVSYLSV